MSRPAGAKICVTVQTCVDTFLHICTIMRCVVVVHVFDIDSELLRNGPSQIIKGLSTSGHTICNPLNEFVYQRGSPNTDTVCKSCWDANLAQCTLGRTSTTNDAFCLNVCANCTGHHACLTCTGTNCQMAELGLPSLLNLTCV